MPGARMDGPSLESSSISAPSTAEHSISAIARRLLPFSAQHPDVWVLQAEASFQVNHITSQATRFNHLLQSLPIEVAVEVQGILANPPTENPYDALKATILSRTSFSECQRFQRLLSTEELGDHRPSQLLRELQSLLGDTAHATDSTLLKHIFLKRLPPSVQMILATALTCLYQHWLLMLTRYWKSPQYILDKIQYMLTRYWKSWTPASTVAFVRSSGATAVAPAATLPSLASYDVAALRERMQYLEELIALVHSTYRRLVILELIGFAHFAVLNIHSFLAKEARRPSNRRAMWRCPSMYDHLLPPTGNHQGR